MGELAIRKPRDTREARAFTRAIVHDIQALERLIELGAIETGIQRMGAEQEMYLIGDNCRPKPCATELLRHIAEPHFTTELARFNLEANLDPCLLRGDFLATLERDLTRKVGLARQAAASLGARVLLTGILPTLRSEDLGADSLTPELRYEALSDAMLKHRGALNVVIDGIDRYEGSYDNVSLEGVNTSFQLHLQVDPAESAGLYNLMQLITAPLLAAASNSPVLLGRRLWHETRVAVFERAFDSRSQPELARGSLTRVSFGHDWVKDSVLEIFHDNAARFPVIMTRELEGDALDLVASGEVPNLHALSLHNGTVWRWNRPCYGVANGVAHLRIENRVLPSGPSIIDEVANAALFYGMMTALPSRYGDVSEQLPFAKAHANFLNAARYGLEAQLDWLGGKQVDTRTLLLEELIPAAYQGLDQLDVPSADSERYLGIIEARVQSGQTGSRWLLNTFAHNRDREPHRVWCDAVDAMLAEQAAGLPVHEWEIPRESRAAAAQPDVAALMTRDLFTLQADDVVDLAASMLDWKHIRHIPVESEDGRPVGLITARELIGIGISDTDSGDDPPAVGSVMRTDFLAVAADTPIDRAIELVLSSDTGCLLVVSDGRLVGIVTERDLLAGTAQS